MGGGGGEGGGRDEVETSGQANFERGHILRLKSLIWIQRQTPFSLSLKVNKNNGQM